MVDAAEEVGGKRIKWKGRGKDAGVGVGGVGRLGGGGWTAGT